MNLKSRNDIFDDNHHVVRIAVKCVIKIQHQQH